MKNMKKLFSALFALELLSGLTFAGSNYVYTESNPSYGYNTGSYGYNNDFAYSQNYNEQNYNQDYNQDYDGDNYGYGSGQAARPRRNQNSNLQGYAVYVPAGVTCQAVLSQEISSETAAVGQSVNVVLNSDFIYNNQTIAPAGSIIYGSVVSNQKAGFGSRNAKMMIRFTAISTPYGNTIPINAVIATSDSTGLLRGGTAADSAKEYAKDTVVGAGAGAALGTAMGALSGGSVGRGAVYGTAVGAGLGLAKGVINKGGSISIPANSVIDLYFTQPITFTAQ